MIDTGPLFNALIINYLLKPGLRMNSRPLLECTDESLRHPHTQLQFLGILSRIPEKLTTSHVIGEINGLVKTRLDLHNPELSRFWNASIELLTLWNLNERLLTLLDFAPGSASEIARVGIVDAGLIHLALQEGCPLITEDSRTLAPLAWEQGIECELLRNLL